MAKAIYLLPGTMCDSRLWQSFANELEVLSNVSYRFHYLTIANLATIDEIVDDIYHQLPKEKLTLVGFSLGGYLASAFAVKYPELIERLIIVSNLPRELPQAEIDERTRTVNWIKRHGYRGIPRKRILPLLDVSAQQNKAIIELIIDMDKMLGQSVLTHQLLATTKRQNLVDSLIALPLNKYFIVGENDNLVDVSFLRKMATVDQRMQLRVLENTGHMLPLEQPTLLAQAFVNWLK